MQKMSKGLWKKKKIERTPVKCLRCGYEWNFSKGIPKYRIKCPKCWSTKNTVNREYFGKWNPNGVKNDQ